MLYFIYLLSLLTASTRGNNELLVERWRKVTYGSQKSVEHVFERRYYDSGHMVKFVEISEVGNNVVDSIICFQFGNIVLKQREFTPRLNNSVQNDSAILLKEETKIINDTLFGVRNQYRDTLNILYSDMDDIKLVVDGSKKKEEKYNGSLKTEKYTADFIPSIMPSYVPYSTLLKSMIVSSLNNRLQKVVFYFKNLTVQKEYVYDGAFIKAITVIVTNGKTKSVYYEGFTYR